MIIAIKPINLLFFLLGITQTICAQYSITGRIADESDSGVPFANVLLLNLPDSTLVRGLVTDLEGKFSFSNVSRGDYFIQSYMVGFEKSYSSKILTREDRDLSIQDIILIEDTQELEEVVVKADKLLYEQTLDRMVINVQSSPLMAGNSVLEILERSPGVIVNRQNSTVMMNGKSGVMVMINGKLTRMDITALFGMLDGMPASNIDKIELITTPPANFDAEGDAGFINIVLKRNDYEGMNGGISAMVGTGRRALYLAGGNFNYRQNKINVFADLNFNHNGNNQFIDTNNEIINDDYVFSSTSRADRFGGYNITTGRIGVDYYVSSKTVIGFLGTLFIRNWVQDTYYQSYYSIEPGIDTLVTGIRTNENPRQQYMMNINFQHQFNDHQQLNVDFDYFIYSSNQFQTYANQYFLEDGQNVYNEDIDIDKITPLSIYVGKIDYRVQLSDQFTFETGAKATLSQLDNDVETKRLEGDSWQTDPQFSEYLTMDEDILAAYGSLSGNINQKLQIKLGLRYEHTVTDLKEQGGTPVVYRNYGNLFPTAFISRKTGEHSSLNLSYSYRITRPSFSELAPFVLFIEPRTYVTGNTSLLPTLTHAIKSTFSFKSVNLSFEYDRISNSIFRFQPSRIPETNTTVLSSLNIDRANMFNFSLSFPITVTSWWEMSNNLTGILNQVTDNYFEEQMNIRQTWFTVNSTHRFILTNNLSMEISGIYYSGGLSGISINEPYGMVSFGLRKEFGKNGGALNLNISDIFRTMLISPSANIPQFNLTNSWTYDFDTRQLKLTYTKNFGNNKLKSRSKRSTGSEEDLKRVGD